MATFQIQQNPSNCHAHNKTQGWGSSFSKGTKFLFRELFSFIVPYLKELSSSNEELFPNPDKT